MLHPGILKLQKNKYQHYIATHSNFEDMAGKSSNDKASRLKSLDERFENDIKELTKPVYWQ